MSQTKKTTSMSRREILRHMGVAIALPMFESLLPLSTAYAAAAPRRRFIGVFAPNGFYMPNAINGGFTFDPFNVPRSDGSVATLDGVLKPFADNGTRSNVMLMRGLKHTWELDPHWDLTAGFLSSRGIRINNVVQAGKTLDQMLADQVNMPIRSLNLGIDDQPGQSDHPGFSDYYLNSISWKDETHPISNINSPQSAFRKLFATSTAAAGQIDYTHTKKRSVLDLVTSQISSVRSRVSKSDRARLDDYLTQVRQVEVEIDKTKPACTDAQNLAVLDMASYAQHWDLMQQMVVIAMKCDLTRAATLMYDTGVSSVSKAYYNDLGLVHHTATHHSGDVATATKLSIIGRQHMRFLADLTKRLKDNNLLEETLILFGSNMSDGNGHATDNMPTLLIGAGSDLKFGQEIGSLSSPKQYSNLLVETAQLLGLSQVTAMGDGPRVSNNVSLGIRNS